MNKKPDAKVYALETEAALDAQYDAIAVDNVITPADNQALHDLLEPEIDTANQRRINKITALKGAVDLKIDEILSERIDDQEAVFDFQTERVLQEKMDALLEAEARDIRYLNLAYDDLLKRFDTYV